MPKTKGKEKLFVVRKYVMADNVEHALQKERKQAPDDIWVDDEWKKGNANQLASAIGFTVTKEEPEQE